MGLIDEIADFRKLDDRLLFGRHFPSGKAQEHTVEFDVLAAGKLRVKARSEFQER